MPNVSGEREAVENGVMGSVVGNTRSEPLRWYSEVETRVSGEKVCSQVRIAVCWRKWRWASRPTS